MAASQQAIIPRKTPVEQSLELFEKALNNPKIDGNNLALILTAMQDWKKELARQEFIEARKCFQDQIQPPKRTRQVVYGKGSNMVQFAHPKMASSLEDIRKCISPYGFSVSWVTGAGEKPGDVRVTCTLSHILGHEVSGFLDGPPENSGSKNAVQAVGSTVTYLQRYTIFPLLGIVPEDQPDSDGKAPGSKLEEQVVRDWLSAMESASDVDELRKAYINAQNVAKAAGDKEAADKFEDYKEKRKAILQRR